MNRGARIWFTPRLRGVTIRNTWRRLLLLVPLVVLAAAESVEIAPSTDAQERQRLLNRPRGSKESRVPVELTLEVDAPVGQEPAHDLMRFAETGERPSALPLDSVLLEHREVADGEHDLSAPARKLIEGRGLLCD